MSVTRITVLKSVIRAGMRFVPNTLAGYRLWATGLFSMVKPLPGFLVTPSHIAGMPSLWICHPSHVTARVILYLHGGGYVFGSGQTHVELACRIARDCQAQVLMPEYRLAPEDPYPAALNDAVSAYLHLLEAGIDPAQITIAGDSAGGGLTLSTAQAIRDRGLPLPAAIVGISPWLDLTCESCASSHRRAHDPLITPSRIRFFARMYGAGRPLNTPEMSPFHHSLKGLPPILLQVGGAELLLSECKAFYRKARESAADIELSVWPHMFHVWHFAARWLPQGKLAISDIGQFVRTHSPAGGYATLTEDGSLPSIARAS